MKTTSTTTATATSFASLLLHLLFLFLLYGASQGGYVYVNNADEFISEISKDTNGTTIFLNSDIDFGGKSYNPPQKYKGSFNGNGHIISNLKMISPYQATGLFGRSNGTTIQNVVIDDSCSIGSSFTIVDTYIGGIIGWCRSIERPCTIESIVNMGNVTFSENIPSDLHLGGIVGVLWSSENFGVVVRNCVNYGTVAHRGNITSDGVGAGYFDMGGIVGHTLGKTRNIQNCVNYGTIVYTGTTINARYIGGIVGNVAGGDTDEKTNIIENCLSAGKITSNEASIIGGIAGVVNRSTKTGITHCFWTSNTGQGSACGASNSSLTITDSSIAELNAETLEKLNEYAKQHGLGESYILHLNGGKINNFDQETVVMSQKRFPDPVKEGNSFLFWCEDKDCAAVYDPAKGTSATEFYAAWSINTVTLDSNGGDELTKKEMTVTFNNTYGSLPTPNRTGYTFLWWFNEDNEEVTNETVVKIPKNHTLRAGWAINQYKVTFDLGNGTVIEDSLEYGKEIVYPEDAGMMREGYTFSGWDKDDESVPAHDLTITAQWVVNEYTVTFDSNGGDELAVKEMTVTFGNAYGTLPTPTKTGYTFVNWFNEKNEVVTNETVVNIPKNHTLTAQWKENPTNQVEIVFGTKDLTEEGIKEIINKYTDDRNYTIIKFDDEGSDEIKVIVKFNDSMTSEKFVDKLRESSEAANNFIMRIGYNHEEYSFSLAYKLTFFLSLFFLI